MLTRRDPWEIVECASCGMVFIGSELPYDVQARDHDWMDEHAKAASERKQKQPVLRRALAPAASAAAEYERPHAFADAALGKGREAGRFRLWRCGFSGARGEIFRRDGNRAESSRRGDFAAADFTGEDSGRPGDGGREPRCPQIRSMWSRSSDTSSTSGIPIAGLRAAFRVLKPGGVTVIKTPNFASWNRTIRGMDWCGYHIPAHCNYFTPRTLSEMLRKAGFEPLARPLADCLPTSDSLWMAARKPK